MNTTELFAEQVLAGLLVLLTGGLVFHPQLLQFYQAHVGKESLEQIVAGGIVVGAAYLIGMVYDRVADTLLQDLEAHCRLLFASGRFNFESPADPFTDGQYRMKVLTSPEATEYMEYLRSRIRLTRALAVAIPGLMMALLLALDWERTSRWWGRLALTIPVVYLGVLVMKLIRRWQLFERPPKTYEIARLRHYYLNRARISANNRDRARRIAWVIFYDEVWIGLLLMLGFASLLIVSTRSYGRFWIPATGLVLTLLVGWVWWRISITFYAFLREFNRNDKSVSSV